MVGQEAPGPEGPGRVKQPGGGKGVGHGTISDVSNSPPSRVSGAAPTYLTISEVTKCVLRPNKAGIPFTQASLIQNQSES